MLRIGSYDPDEKPKQCGPCNVLVGHGYDLKGKWGFRSGLLVSEAVDILTSAGHSIDTLAICNPGKLIYNKNKTYGQCNLRVNVHKRFGQIWIDISPAIPDGKIFEKKTIVVKKKPRIVKRSFDDIKFIE